MSFNIFCGRWDYEFPFYLILTYLAIGVLWNLLLGFPFFDNYKTVTGIYYKLSLTKPKNNPSGR
jgi:hypothetical protein